jgi:hypothetical protein
MLCFSVNFEFGILPLLHGWYCFFMQSLDLYYFADLFQNLMYCHYGIVCSIWKKKLLASHDHVYKIVPYYCGIALDACSILYMD